MCVAAAFQHSISGPQCHDGVPLARGNKNVPMHEMCHHETANVRVSCMKCAIIACMHVSSQVQSVPTFFPTSNHPAQLTFFGSTFGTVERGSSGTSCARQICSCFEIIISEKS